MTTITDKLEAALPANDDDNGPVTLPASVVREAVDELMCWQSIFFQSENDLDAALLKLTDQQNARWLAWSLGGFVVGLFTAGAIGWGL